MNGLLFVLDGTKRKRWAQSLSNLQPMFLSVSRGVVCGMFVRSCWKSRDSCEVLHAHDDGVYRAHMHSTE